MEKFTIDKIIEFHNKIENVEYLSFDENIKYNYEDKYHVEGTITINGSVKTLLDTVSFTENFIIDVFAPANKEIDKENFKINILDYSYSFTENNLTIYLVVKFEGIVDMEKETPFQQNNEIVKQINTLNEIKEERLEPKEEKMLLKENNLSDNVNKTWATDLFKLSDNYSLFMKIHID